MALVFPETPTIGEKANGFTFDGQAWVMTLPANPAAGAAPQPTWASSASRTNPNQPELREQYLSAGRRAVP